MSNLLRSHPMINVQFKPITTALYCSVALKVSVLATLSVGECYKLFVLLHGLCLVEHVDNAKGLSRQLLF